jgi:hypothetical protein
MQLFLELADNFIGVDLSRWFGYTNLLNARRLSMSEGNEWKIKLKGILSIQAPEQGFILLVSEYVEDSEIRLAIVKCYKDQGFAGVDIISDIYGIRVMRDGKPYRVVTLSNYSHINKKIYISVGFP